MEVRGDVSEALIIAACASYAQAVTTSSAQLESLIKTGRKHVPSSWATASSIQLLPAKEADTSDRTLYGRARLASFDRDGYSTKRGLRRPLYYKSGYLSCTQCNGLAFIDASALRSLLELEGLVNIDNIPAEDLPPCGGCGETKGLRVGAHDFLRLIEGRGDHRNRGVLGESISVGAVAKIGLERHDFRVHVDGNVHQGRIVLYISVHDCGLHRRGAQKREVTTVMVYHFAHPAAASCWNFVLIQGGKEALKQRKQMKRLAAITLQRAFRRYLIVQWRRAEQTRQRTAYLLEFRSAQVIQAMLRGRLGRRVHETEKSLSLIKRANGLLIQHALKSFPRRKRVFWYKDRVEEQQLYNDYLVLVHRTGNQPPRIVVEQNIREVATRVLERETELVSRIQARWRGLSVRRYLVVFRREIRRQREVRAGMVFRIQCAVRGWSQRKRAWKWRSEKALKSVLAQYRQEQQVERGIKACANGMKQLCQAYVRERQEEATARLMGHTEPRLTGGLKMKAFNDSPYGDEKVTTLMHDQIRGVQQREKREREVELARKQRAEWLRLKILEDPLLALYFKDEMAMRNASVVGKTCSARRAHTGRALEALRQHNKSGGRKYDFPRKIMEDPMAVLFERHATDGQTLLRRFSKAPKQED